MTQSKTEENILALDLLHFYDEFVEFHDYCAFLCDAFSCLATEEDGLDDSTAMGLIRFSGWMKHRVENLKQELKQIQERSYTENLTKSEV